MNRLPDRRRHRLTLRTTFRGICHFVGAHPDVAEESNPFDKATIVAQALTLACAILLAIVAWWAFLGTFLSPWVAPLGALLVAAMIGLLDRFMMSADWSLSGVLRDGRPPLSWWGRLVARVGVAGLFSIATAIGLTLHVCAGAIDDQLQRNRTATNAPLVAEYATRKDDERRRTLGTLETDVATLQLERDALQERIAALANVKQSQLARAREAANEAGREADGYGGRVQGEGTRWREARRIEATARATAEEAATELETLQARLARLIPELEDKTKTLRAGVATQVERDDAIDAALIADPRWVNERRNALSAFLGLAQLKRDPEYGSTARFFERLFVGLLMALELAVLMIKTIFSPPSVYMVRLIERTKREATQVVTEEAEKTREVIRRQRGRSHLRLVKTGDEESQEDYGTGNALREELE